MACGPSSRSRTSIPKTVVQPLKRPDRPPTVFVCVYRQFIPADQRLRECVVEAAAGDAQLAELNAQLNTGNSIYDWGDDPSFFSAQFLQGSPGRAGWGVCRPNVRRLVQIDDAVVFFCARRALAADPIDYLFAGYGTVGSRIDDRRIFWANPTLLPYRDHFNVLVRPAATGGMEQFERFPPGHEDWEHRAASPYLIFDPLRSHFNMTDPVSVAYAERGDMNETWRETVRAKLIEKILIKDFALERTLRVASTGSSHPHINLTKNLRAAGMTATQLLALLNPLV